MAEEPDTETAKALQEIAKTARQALEIADKAGPFVERVLGAPIENAVGIVSDRLRYYRLVNFYRLADKVKNIHRERGVTDLRRVAPKFALPLIEAATIEEHEELHDLWARLLANAMDPNADQVKRSFVSILQDFEPDDAKVLSFVYRAMEGAAMPASAQRLGAGLSVHVLQFSADLDLTSSDEAEISLSNLSRLGCISLHIQDTWDGAPAERHTEYATIALTALGKALVEASMK